MVEFGVFGTTVAFCVFGAVLVGSEAEEFYS